jgi:hypothetical protein
MAAPAVPHIQSGWAIRPAGPFGAKSGLCVFFDWFRSLTALAVLNDPVESLFDFFNAFIVHTYRYFTNHLNDSAYHPGYGSV